MSFSLPSSNFCSLFPETIMGPEKTCVDPHIHDPHNNPSDFAHTGWSPGALLARGNLASSRWEGVTFRGTRRLGLDGNFQFHLCLLGLCFPLSRRRSVLKIYPGTCPRFSGDEKEVLSMFQPLFEPFRNEKITFPVKPQKRPLFPSPRKNKINHYAADWGRTRNEVFVCFTKSGGFW